MSWAFFPSLFSPVSREAFVQLTRGAEVDAAARAAVEAPVAGSKPSKVTATGLHVTAALSKLLLEDSPWVHLSASDW